MDGIRCKSVNVFGSDQCRIKAWFIDAETQGPRTSTWGVGGWVEGGLPEAIGHVIHVLPDITGPPSTLSS